VRLLILFALLVFSALSPALVRGGAPGAIVWPKVTEVLQGELIELRVAGADLAAVEGSWGKEKIFFYANGDDSFSALVGADVEAKPMLRKLRLKATSSTGAVRESETTLKVKAKSFRRESFNVPPGFDAMTPDALEEIRREREEFAKAFETSATERLWEAPFIRPVPHEASASSFGARRIINGAPRAPHSGTDLSAPAGTEVLAANHGRVALVGNYFFAGGSVVLDHGAGLFTMYFHLSELRVEAGALVKKGEVLGLSGATGRVTGAHLHWGARLTNARVEPFELIRKISPGDERHRSRKSAANKMEQSHGEKRFNP
jgi:murein DD-endopeptidase MepM/ murein hydrolase activator NlpD